MLFSTSTSPKVSIIISTYNGGKYIAETIASIREQSYSNWELVIVDDGSNDNTCGIIEGIKDERIQLHKAGRVGINGRIKNIALHRTSGDLIAFIDHDDLWAPAKLEKQVAALQEHQEAGFCLTGGYNFKIKEEPVEFFYKQTEGIRYGHVFLPLFHSEIAPWTQALLVRKQCIDEVGAFSEAGHFADPEFIFRLAYHFNAVILYEPLMFHRLHETNYTLVNWEASHDEGINVIRTYKKKKMLPAVLARDVLFRSYIHFGEKCLKYKKSSQALSSFLNAWKNKPLNIIPLKKIAKTILYGLKK